MLKRYFLLVCILAFTLSGCSTEDYDLISLVISADMTTVEQGSSINLEVNGLDNNHKEVDVLDAKWELSDEIKGTIVASASEAVFTADKEATGNVKIKVTSDEKSDEIEIVIVKSSQGNLVTGESEKTITQAESLLSTISKGEVTGLSPIKSADLGEKPSLILREDFKAATSKSFTTAEYKSLPNDESQPMYVRKGGHIVIEEGRLVLTGTRFTIGMPKDHPKTDKTTVPNGTLDLTKPYRVTVEISESGLTGDFNIYVDNNSTSINDSYHASQKNDSRLYRETCANIAGLIVDGKFTIEIESVIGTDTSFIQIRTGSDAEVVINSITIEYI